MATLELLTKEDLEMFKLELFAELRRPGQKLHKQSEQKEWLKSYEVRKLLSISPGTLQSLRNTGTLKFNKIGGLMYYKYEDVATLVEGKSREGR
ncbi:transcriptional regulator [Pedobacter sp. PACM 27299]|uniref:helix-turn-helix domain-containing protein n=1 Tax=Pedobacter sp. PACM 27299 TaxID=1727164 RepID=UPI0007065FAA|nr:helix-turn-helix domain-containing protein [Pedobacter sp. PACM 27299]ALL06223.1 transcriptional regulator [Pedobacter sp. PACM 27299]